HSFPTRRSSDLIRIQTDAAALINAWDVFLIRSDNLTYQFRTRTHNTGGVARDQGDFCLDLANCGGSTATGNDDANVFNNPGTWVVSSTASVPIPSTALLLIAGLAWARRP